MVEEAGKPPDPARGMAVRRLVKETGITEAQLKDAPAFSDDSWTDRDWETRTHQHYGAPTYWG